MKKTDASYRVSCRIADAEAHGAAETLLKLCSVEMATCVLGELSKKKLATLQLSKIIVKRRIQDISADIERQLSLFRCNWTTISPLHAVCPTNLIIFHLSPLACCVSVNDEAPHYLFSATSSCFIFIGPDV